MDLEILFYFQHVKKINIAYRIAEKVSDVENADKIILPGVVVMTCYF